MDKELIGFLYTVKERLKEIPQDFTDEVKFLGECLSNVENTHSQNFQDIWALYENRFMSDGFFVEFGATNGVDGSNTYLLEQQYLWSGIVAEPNPIWHEALRNNRFNSTTVVDKCVYSESGKVLDFNATEEPDLATIKGYGTDDEHSQKRNSGQLIKVSTISLYDMLKKSYAPYLINYMSIDTEGSEHDILQAFFKENDKYNIKCITVEHNFNQENRDKLFNLLSSQGYRRKFTEFSRWDDFYIKD